MFPGLFNDFDSLNAREMSEPAPFRKLEIRRLQLVAAFLAFHDNFLQDLA